MESETTSREGILISNRFLSELSRFNRSRQKSLEKGASNAIELDPEGERKPCQKVMTLQALSPTWRFASSNALFVTEATCAATYSMLRSNFQFLEAVLVSRGACPSLLQNLLLVSRKENTDVLLAHTVELNEVSALLVCGRRTR